MKYLPFLLLLISCIPDPKGEQYIDPKLRPYFDTFYAEAEKLGVELPTKDVLAYFEEFDGYRAWTYWNERIIRMRVDPEIHDWGSYSLEVEATIFHELGHGYLNRHHLEYTSVPVESLMTIPHGGRSGWMDGSMREYYLNELFGDKIETSK
jgi:hypothetical protein